MQAIADGVDLAPYPLSSAEEAVIREARARRIRAGQRRDEAASRRPNRAVLARAGRKSAALKRLRRAAALSSSPFQPEVRDMHDDTAFDPLVGVTRPAPRDADVEDIAFAMAEGASALGFDAGIQAFAASLAVFLAAHDMRTGSPAAERAVDIVTRGAIALLRGSEGTAPSTRSFQ
ncbi:hypothetical protein JDN40_00740 [Rhodomicrobium vannielii ATCC 17100]|uniref:hypothetical protein n=1 Tax=Rhodomicrobium vannielii TaxID=1069 RepID=UPI00191A961F|nr:hypothetical protein [Rhodomicrobium vannielii]MBJ7532660.1 hypothetical protein [Rhodomicrobium vannielii ATCC 17100]